MIEIKAIEGGQNGHLSVDSASGGKPTKTKKQKKRQKQKQRNNSQKQKQRKQFDNDMNLMNLLPLNLKTQRKNWKTKYQIEILFEVMPFC